jgi:hypothetical protein
VLENTSTTRSVVIAPGQYNAMTLKDAVVTALNGVGKTITAQYAVEYRTYSNRLAVSLTQAGDTVDIWPASVVKANPAGWFIPGTRDSSAVTGFAWAAVQTVTDVLHAVGNNAPNCQPYHQLFLRSSLGNGYDAIGPDNSSDIIRRIVCTVPLNDICVDQHGLGHDSVTVGTNREINSLSFRLTDVYGNTVDTNGHHVSFSILFIEDV